MATRLVLISVPPAPLRDELEALRAELCAAGRSREALRYPVHLTLRTGVLLPDAERARFAEAFAEHAAAVDPFRIVLGRFVADALPDTGQQGGGARFAGYEIEAGSELMAAHAALAAFSLHRKGEQYPYRPHLTMAFDDLDERGLEAVRAAAEGKTETFVGTGWLCERVEFHRRNGERWELDFSIPLGAGSGNPFG